MESGFTTYEERGFDLYKLHSLLWLSLKHQNLLGDGLNKERVASALVLQEIYFKGLSEQDFLQSVDSRLSLGQAMVSAWATALGSDMPSVLDFYTANKELVDNYIDTLDKGAEVAQQIYLEHEKVKNGTANNSTPS